MNLQKIDALAQATIRQGYRRPSTHGQGRWVYQKRFLRPIGRSARGKPAYQMRVVTDRHGRIITAFPV